MVNLIIVTHGEFGAYLVEAAEEIVGKQPEGVRVIAISSRFSLAEAKKKILRAIEEVGTADGLILATDIPGGTPSNLALPIARDMPGVFVVSGLNLYMLISAFNQRKSFPAAAVVEKMLADGKKSIQDMKAILRTKYNANHSRPH